ncbi:MAG TPA: helix-turn-helix domain-containing protein [Mucilaginibacter sp.]|nr:helix-turn-helix domain-containing protein [Mucilaginibacter sp.]
MKHVSIVVPRGPIILSSVIGTFKVLNFANGSMISRGKKPVFDVHLIGLERENNLYNGLFAVRPDLLVSDAPRTDLIMIPAFNGDPVEGMKRNQDFVPWITAQYKRGSEIASLCTGAFLLASTNLLKGRTCTTHWMSADAFRQEFPGVKLLPEKLLIDEQGIYSSGGAYSFLNLVQYLVEKYCGRDVAVHCAKVLEIEIDRESQSPFMIFSGQKEHLDEPIKKAQLYIERNFSNKITVDQLSEMFAISRRNFERRFKKATRNTPVEYLQRVKIEAAKKSLEAGRENVNEVMYAVGYSDHKAFRTIFKKITGLSPIEYRNKYSREMAMN